MELEKRGAARLRFEALRPAFFGSASAVLMGRDDRHSDLSSCDLHGFHPLPFVCGQGE
jgi:hypothetical protein